MFHPDFAVKIFTAGYAQWRDQQSLFKMVLKMKALLVDVRLHPVSRYRPEWTKQELKQTFTKYIHLKDYGNESFGTDKPAKLLNPVRASDELLNWTHKGERNFLFLCACANHKLCHRSLAADHFQEALTKSNYSSSIHHLKPGGQETLF